MGTAVEQKIIFMYKKLILFLCAVIVFATQSWGTTSNLSPTLSAASDSAGILSLSVSPESLNFTASGGQQTFAITSNTDWTVSSSESWLTVSQDSGSNNDTITVIAAPDTANIPRTATIAIIGSGIDRNGDGIFDNHDAFIISVTQAVSQNALQTWQLSPTMTATLDSIGVMTISTTQAEGEAMPYYDWNTAPWYAVLADIRSLEIKDKVTTIGDYAFYGCSNLTSVSIPNSVTLIGPMSFVQTGITSVTIPAKVEYIGPNAFWDCASLATVYFNAANCQTMGYYDDVSYSWWPAFWGDDALHTVVIGDSVKNIPDFAFCGSGLQTVSIPGNVEHIGISAFSYCDQLTAINVVETNPFYTDINGVLFDKNKTILMQCPAGKTGEYTLPATTDSIADYAFYGCSELTNIVIPNHTQSIGLLAFEYAGITELTIPESITSIGRFAFYDCPSLETVNFNAVNCTDTGYIGSGHVYPIFSECSSLHTANIGNNVQTIPSYAFHSSPITTVTIGNSVTAIKAYAFINCTALTDVTVNWTSPLSVSASIFNAVNTAEATLHVPSGTKALYQADPVWGTFGTIDDESATPILSVSPESLSFAASGEKQTFLITSNTDWRVNCSDSTWVKISPTSGSNNGTVTVTAVANSDTIQRIATITISGTGAAAQMISITQNAMENNNVIPTTTPADTNGTGKIELSLAIPSNTTLTGSFEITFPEGVTLDEESTALIPELAKNFYLSFTDKGNNTWLIEIISNLLRSSTEVELNKIMDIAYKVDENVSVGEYEATIANLDFALDDGTSIQEDELPVILTVVNDTNNTTSIESVNSDFNAYTVNSMLCVESSHRELISVYSVAGNLLYSEMKESGRIEIPFSFLPGSVYIIKGSISGTIKIVK